MPQVALLQEELNQERKIKWGSSAKMVSQVRQRAQNAETRAERAEKKVAVLEEENKKLEEALSEARHMLQESVERSSTLVTEKKRVRAENEESEKKRFKVENEKKRFKGILHQKNFYRLNLIFWIVMGCGIADLGRRGL